MIGQKCERGGLAAAVLSAALLLTACDPKPDPTPPSPALWQVENAKGELEGWLFGTIHALPDGVEWRTAALDDALQDTKLLVVEVANLDDRETLAGIFQEMATTPDLPILEQRVRPEFVGKLAALMAKGGFNEGDFRDTETWAAALTLGQVYANGDPDNGVDRALLSMGKTAIELEGARDQLTIFDTLAEEDQRTLLEAIIAESVEAESNPGDLAKKWRDGDIAALEAETTSGMMADPELRAALITDRNADWLKKLKPLMTENEPLMVAVGTGHLVGDGGLPELLAAEGFTVTRIQ